MSGYTLKDVVGYEGLYAVTDDGRVWSHISNKWLKPSADGGNYRKVCLYTKNSPKDYRQIKVHKLVADAFCPKPEGACEVNHIDGDKSNNSAKNLEWVTSSQNKVHAWKNGLRGGVDDGLVKHNRSRRKLGQDSIISIRQMKKHGWTAKAISRIYGVNINSIFKIVKKHSYKEVV